MSIDLPFDNFPLWAIGLLFISSFFMAAAWYGHLRYRMPVWGAILFGWAIAFMEYMFSIPAIRYAYNAGLDLVALKAVQLSLGIFAFVIFAMFFLKETPRWPHAIGFGLIITGLALVFTV